MLPASCARCAVRDDAPLQSPAVPEYTQKCRDFLHCTTHKLWLQNHVHRQPIAPAPGQCLQRSCNGRWCVHGERWPTRLGCWARCERSVRCCGGCCRCRQVRWHGARRRWRTVPCEGVAAGAAVWRRPVLHIWGYPTRMLLTHLLLEHLQVEWRHNRFVGLCVFLVCVDRIPGFHGALESCVPGIATCRSTSPYVVPLTALVSNQLSVRAPSGSAVSTRSKSSHFGASNS